MRYNAVRHAYFTLLVLICLSVAVGCGGGRGNGVTGAEINPQLGADGQLAPAPGLPADDYVDPAEILARRGSELTSQTRTGAEAEAASDNTTVVADTLEFAPGGAAAGAWAVYRFPDLLDSDFPLRLEFGFDVDAGLPDECYFGLSNYTDERWDWTGVAVPTGSDSLPVPADIGAVSPGGNLYAIVMVRGAAAAVLDTVTLHLDSYYLPAPNGLGASAGTVDGVIRLTWDDPAVTYPGLDFTGVAVERALDPAGPWEEIAVVDAAQTGYDDEIDAEQGIDPLVPVYYRLRTVLNEIQGAPGLAVSGWLAVPTVGYLTASDLLPDKIRINWEPVAAADYYLLEYHYLESSTTGWTLLAEVAAAPDPVFMHMEGSPVGCYFTEVHPFEYRVKAVVGETASLDWSPIDTGSGRYEISFDASDGMSADYVLLDWDHSAWDPNYDWDEYAIYYRNLEGGAPADWTLLHQDSRYEGTSNHSSTEPVGLESEYGAVYEYRLYGMINEEIFWEVLASDTGYRAIPDVTNLTASGDDPAGIHLAWDESTGAEGYRLEYRNADEGSPTAWTSLADTDATTTTLDHTAAAPDGREAAADTLYEYRAKALWSGQVSYNWSDTVSGVMGFGVVAGFTASDGLYRDRTVLAWDALNLADAYVIEYRSLDGLMPEDWTLLTEVGDGATTSFSHTESQPPGRGCALHTNYEYRIRGRRGTEYGYDWAADEGHAGAGPGDWNMDGRGPKHQRRSSFTGPETPELLWSIELSIAQPACPVSLGADGTIYFCQNYNSLYAVNPDGSIRWVHDEISCGYGMAPYISPDGSILVVGQVSDGTYGEGLYLKAVNPDGTTDWMQYGRGGYSHFFMPFPVPLPDETIIWASPAAETLEYGRLLATYPDGSPRWGYTDYFSVLLTPAVAADGTIYASVSDYYAGGSPYSIPHTFRLHAINPDGSTAWLSDEVNCAASPSVGDDGRIYVCVINAEENSDLYCYEPDGTLAWDLGLTGHSMSGLAIAANGTIHTGFLRDGVSANHRAYAVDPDGSVRWVYEQYRGGYSGDPSPAIDGDGTVYLGFGDGIHAVNPDGSQKWVYLTDSEVEMSPTISPAGRIYFPAGKVVYAIGEGTE